MERTGPTGRSKYVFLILRLAVVGVGLAWAAWWFTKKQLWGKLAAVFAGMSPLLFAVALVVFAIGQLIIALRWWLLLRSQGIFISIAAAVRLHFLGLFYNNFMPSSVGGDLIRAWYVTRHTDKRLEAALSVFVDRVIGLVSTLVIAGFFYTIFLRGQAGAIFQRGDNSGGVLATAAEYRYVFVWAVGIVGAFFGLLLSNSKGREILAKTWSQFRLRGLGILTKTTNAVIVYSRSGGTVLAVFGLTVLMQLTVITGFYFVGKDIGVAVSIKYYYVFFTLTWVLGALPVSIGGAVVVEGLLAYMFIQFAGVDSEAAAALALCQRAIWMLTSLPGAFIHLAGAHLPGQPADAETGPQITEKDFFIDSNRPAG